MASEKPNDKVIFNVARNIASPRDRKEYLHRACGADEILFQRVSELLDAYEEESNFLEHPAASFDLTVNMPPSVSEQVGDRIGPFKLLQQIGEGGMGVVYMAEQTEPITRRVALKIIKPGMDSRQVVARFEAERQALAMMDHPNISRVLDAGMTDSGRPYFVMELVKGRPITDYCDERRLTTRERLELFLPVCQAIQHAHQKGIIHRDIKPSNVMVTHYDDQPVPKVIDFGVAKAMEHSLTEKTMFTAFGQVLGTFEYMSPEQATLNQWDVDTRTDIYSLGVLLYEVLSGATPFDRERLRSQALDKLIKIIREEDPPLPSTRLSKSHERELIAGNRKTEPKQLCAIIRGDLDWIVMKAIEKDRTRRYETANGLKADIQRYLDGDAVTAAPPSTTYRLRKLAKRHRVAVVISLLVTSALLLGIVGTSIGMAQAYIEKGRADEQADLARSAKEDAESARDEARYTQYVASIPAADKYLQGNVALHAQSILRTAPPEFRNWEWALLANRAWPPQRLINSTPRSATGELTFRQFWTLGTAKFERELLPWNAPGGLHGGFFSQTGDSVCFYHARGEIKLFSFPQIVEQSLFSSESGNSLAVALSQAGTKLAGFPFSNRGRVWDVATTDVVATFNDSLETSSPWLCQWSPDENYVVTGHMGGAVRIWDARFKSLDPLRECLGHQKDVMNIQFLNSSDSFWTASTDGTVRQWSFPGGKAMGEYKLPVTGELEFQAISPTTGKLAFASLRDGSSLLWDIQSETVVRHLSGPTPDPYSGAPRYACAFSRDETGIAVMTGRLEVSVYDLASGEVLNRISGNDIPLRCVALSPDGTVLLTVSEDGKARFWSCSADEEINLAQAHGDTILQVDSQEVSHSADALLLAGSYDGTASIWNLSDGRRKTLFEEHQAEIIAVDLLPDGTHAATLDAKGVIRVWNTVNENQIFMIDPESNQLADHLGGAGGGLRSNLLNYPAPLSTGIYTPDGAHIVAFQKDAMRVFQARNGHVETVLESASTSGWPVYSHDSSLVAILNMWATDAGVWDLSTGDRVHGEIKHNAPLVMMQFSPVDQRLVTCAMEPDVIIWDGQSGAELCRLKAQAGDPASCRFSRDGKYVLTSHGDGSARVWDSQTGKVITTLIGHTQRGRDVRFNPDQTRLLTWAMDDKAIIWDFARPQPYANQLLILEGDSKLLQAHWSPDGRDLVTAWSDGGVQVFQGATQEDIAELKDDSEDFEDNFRVWQSRHMNVFEE